MNKRVKANKSNSTQVEGEAECSRMMQEVNPEMDPFWNSYSLNFFHRIRYSAHPGPWEHKSHLSVLQLLSSHYNYICSCVPYWSTSNYFQDISCTVSRPQKWSFLTTCFSHFPGGTLFMIQWKSSPVLNLLAKSSRACSGRGAWNLHHPLIMYTKSKDYQNMGKEEKLTTAGN